MTGDKIIDILNLVPEDDEYREIVASDVIGFDDLIALIDTDRLLEYMKEEFASYANDNKLCPHCGSPLIKGHETGEAWGAKYTEETEICPKGCF